MSKPIEHPRWCDRTDTPTWPVHSADVGTVPVAEHVSFEICLRQWMAATTPVVSVTLVNGDEDTLIDLTPTKALELARRLTEAAQILLGTWAPLATDEGTACGGEWL